MPADLTPIEDLDRLALLRRQLAGAGDGLTWVQRGVLAEDLVRVVDPEPGPGALFLAGHRWTKWGIEPPPSAYLAEAPEGEIDPVYWSEYGL